MMFPPPPQIIFQTVKRGIGSIAVGNRCTCLGR